MQPSLQLELAAIVGAENVLPDAIVLPANITELSAILRYANSYKIPVAPHGGPAKNITGINLRTSRLNQVKEHIWQDMTCTVEAGTTWSAMQTILSQHHQFVALDPLFPDTATVGGIVATNDSGALRMKYGSLRDLIIGMTIVLADGTIAKTGGKVVKNVAGYDLHKLMTGAHGTLGVIAEVTFRLHATPAHTRSVTIYSPDSPDSPNANALGSLLLELTASQLSLHALQLRTVRTSESQATFALDVSLATMPSVLTHQLTQLETMAAAHSLTIADAAPDIWSAREAVYAGAYVVKAAMLPTDIAHISTLIGTLSGTAVTQAGGIMTAAFATPESIAPLRREVENAHGHLTILRQPESSSLPVWGPAPDTLPLMQQIKQRFDPNGILNPGCFLDGI